VNDSTSKKAPSYLKKANRELGSILLKVQVLQELEVCLLAYLPVAMRSYCQVANLEKGRLTLMVANGSIATELRFQTHELLMKFKQDPKLQRISEIRCKVRPPIARSAPAKTPAPVPLLSPETAQMVQEMAESLTHSPLREVMTKIAHHRKK